MTDIDPSINERAVNVYTNDMADDFPVLKAFQQYIDAEQAKARKRMLLICAFFSFILTVVIGVFVSLLLMASSRNQTLNDRLIEYAMKDRERPAQIAPMTKDDSAFRTLSNRMEEITKALAESQARSEKAAAEKAVAKAVEMEDKMRKTADALEIERLKSLLAAEKEKTSLEREKKRQAELEAYRRAHYPEFYEKKSKPSRKTEEEEADREIDSIIKDIKAINYFDEDDEQEPVRRPLKKKDVTPSKGDAVEVPTTVKDSSGRSWGIPED